MLESGFKPKFWRSGRILTMIGSLTLLMLSGQAQLQADGIRLPAYSDVTDGNVHRENIAILKAAGILDGTECGPDQFCPGDPLSRRTFAVWMVRVLDGNRSPSFVGPGVDGESDFADVEANEPEALFIKRLAHLRVTSGCGVQPWRYCPDESVSRSQMASFLSRAFRLPDAPDANFTDVGKDSVHFENINRLAAAGITQGCSSEPKRYCPDSPTTRAQMASFLARTVAWRGEPLEDVNKPIVDRPAKPEPAPTVRFSVSGSDNSVRPEVEIHQHYSGQPRVSWRPNSDQPDQVDRYILQWRRGWEEFNHDLQQVIDADELSNGQYSFSIVHHNVYGVRVVIDRGGFYQATDEVKVDSLPNQLRDQIKEKIVDVYGDQHPWLKDTWNHINSEKFTFGVNDRIGSFARVSMGGGADGQVWAKRLAVHPAMVTYFDNLGNQGVLIHELAHVYNQSNGLTKKSGAIGIGYLYHHLLVLENEGSRPDRCISNELYAELGVISFYGLGSEFYAPFGPGYWSSCNLKLSDQKLAQVNREVPEIAQAVFIDQKLPDWFYDNYQNPDGKLDLEQLWADINIRDYQSPKAIMIYHLRHEFGGYCDENWIANYIQRKVDNVRNPWRDGGCAEF